METALIFVWLSVKNIFIAVWLSVKNIIIAVWLSVKKHYYRCVVECEKRDSLKIVSGSWVVGGMERWWVTETTDGEVEAFGDG